MVRIIKRYLRESFPDQMGLMDLCRMFMHDRYLLRACLSLFVWEDSYLKKTGWIRSVKENNPVDANGRHLPWMNYSAIAFLSERLKTDFNVFEYGSGSSTIFFSQLVNSIVSVEYDTFWYEKVSKEMPENVSLVSREADVDGTYCRTITEFPEKFDIVIIDGRDRVNCIRQSINKLTERGVIILDDSSREKYKTGVDFVVERGFRHIAFEGIKPNGSIIDTTSVFYRDNNCLCI